MAAKDTFKRILALRHPALSLVLHVNTGQILPSDFPSRTGHVWIAVFTQAGEMDRVSFPSVSILTFKLSPVGNISRPKSERGGTE